MPDVEMKLLLYTLKRQLDEAQTSREKIIEKYKSQLTPEIQEQLNNLDKLIESFQTQIKLLL